jgi:hypothetical protein
MTSKMKNLKLLDKKDCASSEKNRPEEMINNNASLYYPKNIDRFEFLKRMELTLGAALVPCGVAKSMSENHSAIHKTSDITYNTFPRWRGFNLLGKFTHKPDEWINVAQEWGFKNEPFRESGFALIKEFGFNYVRLPMSYKCWCNGNNWYKLNEKHLREIDKAVEYGKQF